VPPIREHEPPHFGKVVVLLLLSPSPLGEEAAEPLLEPLSPQSLNGDMANITYDGKSFLIDGRRVWLVSGAIHYGRVPRDLWRARIRAAKQCGLNCIETPVFWNLHEPTPGGFEFDGERDLRQFVRIIGEEGLFCILRPGPYVGSDWDLGGLPAWLHRDEATPLRQAQPRFLEASARYIGAVMAQVQDLQVTQLTPTWPEGGSAMNLPGHAAGGFASGPLASNPRPILLMQAEHAWLCGNAEQEERYLRQIARYLRENGATVPITNANQLYQQVEGTLDVWSTSWHLGTDLRQLAVVQPQAPRLVSYAPGQSDTWARKHETLDPALHEYRLGQILAAAGQFNLDPFHGGTNFAFNAGCDPYREAGFITTSHDHDAPLSEAGGRGEKYFATKRVSTFASQFHHVLANLEPERPHAAVAATESGHPVSVVHRRGDQGDLVMALKAAEDKTREVQLMLPDGQILPVPMGQDRIAWLLLEANLGGVRLNDTNLRPWALLNKQMLVLFGPGGSEGILTLNDVQLQVQVPNGKKPTVTAHEGLTIVVLNRQQVDATHITEHGITIGCNSLDGEGRPLPLAGWGQMQHVSLDGSIRENRVTAPRKPDAPKLTAWEHAGTGSLIDGSEDVFEPMDSPAALETLDTDFGYGWYKVSIGKSKQGKLMLPQGGDRLHIYQSGKLKTVLGEGPGAQRDPVSLTLSDDVIVLADNLGRRSGGAHLGEPKGMADHLYTVEAVKLNQPKRISERAADPFALTGYVPGHRKGYLPPSESLAWTVKPLNRKPMIVQIDGLPQDAVLLVNDTPFAFYAAGEHGPVRCLLDPKAQDAVTGGQNQIKLSPMKPFEKKVNATKHFSVYQVKETITAKAQWHFAPWQVPNDEAFATPPASLPAQPGWFRATFNLKQTAMPLFLEPRGMSKGQLFLNGYNIGRYFQNTREGKHVGPQNQYYLPELWLRADEPNALTLFDEHGHSPSHVRLVYNPTGPFGR